MTLLARSLSHDRVGARSPFLNSCLCCEGGSDPTNFLGGWKPKKWGRSSPTRCFARVQIGPCAMCNPLFLGHLLGRQSDREGDGYGDLCLSCTRHPPALQLAFEAR